MDRSDIDAWHMARALELAAAGRGYVEPNPMVGCIVARGAEIVGEGWHRRHGGPHAEVEALTLAGRRAAGATAYVTLEPCCHQGKTPPCTIALITAGVGRVVIAMEDPFPEVGGRGIAKLKAAGIQVDVGPLRREARRLNAPYLKLLETGRPWVTAKWAMTLDGKIATTTGDSRWISGELSRAAAHQLRGCADAILIGRGTAAQDDPLLTARPSGPRTAVRIVADTLASLSSESRLVSTAHETPVLVAVGTEAPGQDVERLIAAGCELFVCGCSTPQERLGTLLDELGRRRMTNLLVEGGGQLLGTLLEIRAIDEVHLFIAPKLIGGSHAPGPIAGQGIAEIAEALALVDVQFEQLGDDLYLTGRVS